jgi:hypothetical protein
LENCFEIGILTFPKMDRRARVASKWEKKVEIFRNNKHVRMSPGVRKRENVFRWEDQ